MYGRALLRFPPILLQGEDSWLVLLRSVKKAEGLASLLGVLGMVDVVRVNHTLEVLAAAFRAPFDALVNDDVVEYEVEEAIAEDANTGCYAVRTVSNEAVIVDQTYGWYTEHHGEPIVSFKGVVVYGVMGSVPDPKNPVHDVFVGKPGYKFPEKERAHSDQRAKDNGGQGGLIHYFLKYDSRT